VPLRPEVNSILISSLSLSLHLPKEKEKEIHLVLVERGRKHTRIPATLLAAIATPNPVPQINSARSAFPSATSLAASTAKWGYAVLSSAVRGPTSLTRWTRGSCSKSAEIIFL